MGIDLMASRRRLVMAQPHLASTTPANPVSFSATLAAPLKGLECAFSPVQSGSGDPAPDNVRAISGWTGCNVTRCGKNLFDTTYEGGTVNGTTITTLADGRVQTSGTPSSSFNEVIGTAHLSAGTYTLSGCPSGGGSAYKLQVTDYPVVNNLGQDSGNGVSFTLAEEMDVAVRIQLYTSAPSSLTFSPMICLSSATNPTTYAPYTGQTLAVQFPAEAGTIYGGYIDPVRGVARATTERVIMTGVATYPPERSRVSFFGKSAATDRDEYYARLVGARQNSDVSGWYCSAAQVKARADISSPTALTFTQISVGDVNEPRLAFPLSMGIDTVEKANQFLANMLAADTPVVYAYPLATPIEYPLTPAVLKTLKGDNVLYTSLNGDITPTFWTH